MQVAMRACLLGLMLALGTGCGPSAQQKTAESANNNIAEYNSMVPWFNGAAPQGTWSTADLDAYEMKLNRFALLRQELEKNNGKDGVLIFNLISREKIINRQARLTVARMSQVTLQPQDPASPAEDN